VAALVGAANWAQVSGTKKQNVVRQTTITFSKRWGHTMVAYVDPRRSETTLVVLGGESYDPVSGVGTLLNDVWKTRGLGTYAVHAVARLVCLRTQKSALGVAASQLRRCAPRCAGWRVVDSPVKRTHYGAPLPQIISTTRWDQSGATDLTYSVPYRQMLCCDRTLPSDMWPCDPNANGSSSTMTTRVHMPNYTHECMQPQHRRAALTVRC
jgi:hypothetical protein